MNPWPSTGATVLRQVRYQLLILWRTPIAMFFTIILPLVMLVVFNLIFANETVSSPAGEWPLQQFYTGSIAAFTAVSASFTNLANVVPIRREEGVLKRWRGTPLPPWTHIAGLIGSATLLAIAGSILMIAVGVAFYDVEIDPARMPAALLAIVVGVVSFSSLGIALGSVVPTASAAPAAANAFILPLAFVSGVFIPLDDAPQWLTTVGDVFPLRPFATSVQDAFHPLVEPPALYPGRLAVVAAWGIAGAIASARFFEWSPSVQSSRHARGSRRRADTSASEVVREA